MWSRCSLSSLSGLYLPQLGLALPLLIVVSGFPHRIPTLDLQPFLLLVILVRLLAPYASRIVGPYRSVRPMNLVSETVACDSSLLFLHHRICGSLSVRKMGLLDLVRSGWQFDWLHEKHVLRLLMYHRTGTRRVCL